MLETFSTTLVQTLRIAVLISLGFFFAKKKIMPEAFRSVISKLITRLLNPMLIVYTFMTRCNVETLAQGGTLVLYGACFVALAVTLSLLLCRRLSFGNGRMVSVLRYAIAFPNTGAFLTPLVLAFLGTEGYFYSSLCLFVFNAATYSWGLMQLIPAGERPADRRGRIIAFLKRVFSLNVLSMLTGMVLGLLGAGSWMPQIVTDNMKIFGDCYVPMSLLVIGFTIADYDLRTMLPNRTTCWFIGLRMLVMPFLMLLLMKLLHAPYYACYFAFAAYTCPCGMNVIVYPLAYGQECRDACALVLCSCVFSVISIPLMYALMGLLI